MERERSLDAKQPHQEGAGRLCKPGEQQSPTESTSDISFVDCQEGDMNNGELGGNFIQIADNERSSG